MKVFNKNNPEQKRDLNNLNIDQRFEYALSNASTLNPNAGITEIFAVMQSNDIDKFNQITLGFESLPIDKRMKILTNGPTDPTIPGYGSNIAAMLLATGRINEFGRLGKVKDDDNGESDALPPLADRFKLLSGYATLAGNPSYIVNVAGCLLELNKFVMYEKFSRWFEDLSIEHRAQLLCPQFNESNNAVAIQSLAVMLLATNSYLCFARLTAGFEKLPKEQRRRILVSAVQNKKHPEYGKTVEELCESKGRLEELSRLTGKSYQNNSDDKQTSASQTKPGSTLGANAALYLKSPSKLITVNVEDVSGRNVNDYDDKSPRLK